MAKTQEELNELKQELETLKNKLKELTDDELKLITGGGEDFVAIEPGPAYTYICTPAIIEDKNRQG